MSVAVAVQVRDGVALAADSATYVVSYSAPAATWGAPERLPDQPKIIRLSSHLPLAFVAWGVLGVEGDEVRDIPNICAELRRRFDGEGDTPALEMGAYQLEDVARQVADAIALHFVPVFRGGKQGAGGFIADHTGFVRFLVRHDGVAQCFRYCPPGLGAIDMSPSADRVQQLIPQALAAIEGGLSLTGAGRLASALVAEQIVWSRAHPNPRSVFAGPVQVVMLSAAGAQQFTLPLVEPEPVA